MAMPTLPRRSANALGLAQIYREALTLHQQGRYRDADTLCRQILSVAPDHFDTLYLLCRVLKAAGRPAEAVTFGRKALNQRPNSIEAVREVGQALAAAGRSEDAIARFQKALSRAPNNTDLLNDLGSVLYEEGRFGEARACYEKALGIAPNKAEFEHNVGSVLTALHQPAAAIEHFRRGQALTPDLAMAHYNEATALLLAGDYVAGWRKFEARWNVPGAKAMYYAGSEPLWLGDHDISGRTILLWGEQGLGDVLQFARYVPLVAETGARMIFLVPPQLVSLMQTLDGPAELHTTLDSLPARDFQCPLMSLPLAFGTTADTIPNRVPYLSADPAKAARWRARLEKLPGRRVGLVWHGRSPQGNSVLSSPDRRRSLALAQLAPLAVVAEVSFVSLQLGKPVHPAAAPPGLVLHDWTPEIKDFSDTAALVDGLDLVISVDTSTAHLAGALGKPVWLMNRFDTDWRWLLDRDDSPWYPTLRQFRQPEPGDWSSVVANVAAALGAFADG